MTFLLENSVTVIHVPEEQNAQEIVILCYDTG